ncbi:AbrB family transcriptional regulator [Ureibacillus sp. NPDC094379]
MDKNRDIFRIVWFITVSGLGGFLLSLTGLSIGWMIGTLLLSTTLSILSPEFLKLTHNEKGIPKYWLYIGQCILGIELGQKVNSSVVDLFQENWLTIIIMLLLSIFFSLLSGIILWKYTHLDMLTSFFATAPGGLSAIPGIAEEVGANTGVVSIIQAMRVFLVILIMPVIISILNENSSGHEYNPVTTELAKVGIEQIPVTILFVFIAIIGYYIGKFSRFPAPWLIGGMVSVAAIKFLSLGLIGYDLVAWWPHSLIIVSQIFIGASIGSRFHKNMFIGLNRTLLVSFISTIGLIVFVFICAYFVSVITDIPFLTAGLAFAPGGVAEMTTTALVLNGDATFVVAVQVLRIITVCVTLPPFFKLLKYLDDRKKNQEHIST